MNCGGAIERWLTGNPGRVRKFFGGVAVFGAEFRIEWWSSSTPFRHFPLAELAFDLRRAVQVITMFTPLSVQTRSSRAAMTRCLAPARRRAAPVARQVPVSSSP